MIKKNIPLSCKVRLQLEHRKRRTLPMRLLLRLSLFSLLLKNKLIEKRNDMKKSKPSLCEYFGKNLQKNSATQLDTCTIGPSFPKLNPDATLKSYSILLMIAIIIFKYNNNNNNNNNKIK